MNILYCGDKNILDGVLISVLSLMEHVHEPLHIHLLTAAIETQEKNFEPLPDTFVSFFGFSREAEMPHFRPFSYRISAKISLCSAERPL